MGEKSAVGWVGGIARAGGIIPATPYKMDSSLRPCLGKGASLGEEAVLADSGREGEIVARVGRVRNLGFLSILRECFVLFQDVQAIEFQQCHKSFSADSTTTLSRTSRS